MKYVSFHIGRGGRFNTAGFLTFTGEEDFQGLLRRCSDTIILVNEDVDGNPLTDSRYCIL